MSKKKYNNYESAVERLEEITEILESGDSSLDDSISLYTEGLEIAGFCNKKLSQAEEKVKVIKEKNGLFTEEEFETDGDED